MTEYQIKTKARWRKSETEYGGDIYRLYLGKLCLATVSWDGISPRELSERYRAESCLPTKKRIGNFATEDEARKACHLVIDEVINLLQAK